MSNGGEDRVGNGWVEYRNLVLHELKRIDERVGFTEAALKMSIADTEKKLVDKLDALQAMHRITRDDVIALKTKAAMIGFLAGAVPAIISILYTISKTSGGG